MLQVIRELSIKKYLHKYMQYILDFSGLPKEEFRNSTNRKYCYSVYHAFITWILHIRVKKARILLKLKACDVIGMSE